MSPTDDPAPAQRLIVIGAVDLAVALCRLAHAAGWRSFVADPRADLARIERFPEAEAVAFVGAEAAFARFGPLDAATAVAVLAHDPEIDDDALTLALGSDAGYVGALGGRPTQAARRARLLGRGLTEAELGRLAGPIGLDLGAVGPEETALAVMAEIVALRHGRAGGRLKHAAGRIRAVEA